MEEGHSSLDIAAALLKLVDSPAGGRNTDPIQDVHRNVHREGWRR
jgi:hypothetical protein